MSEQDLIYTLIAEADRDNTLLTPCIDFMFFLKELKINLHLTVVRYLKEIEWSYLIDYL